MLHDAEQGDEADEAGAYWSFAAYPRCWADEGRATGVQGAKAPR
jgi:hypothetical protein